jgi:hypothetical protein
MLEKDVGKKRAQTWKINNVPADRLLRVKKVFDGGRVCYTLRKNDGGDYHYCLSEDILRANPIALKSKNLGDLGKMIGMLRAGMLIKEGIIISEEDGFHERGIESFYEHYERGYLEVARGFSREMFPQ